MPRVPDSFLETVFYLYPTEAAAWAGERVGGTGFIASVPSDLDPEKGFHYAVTNDHVVRDKENPCPVIRFNTNDGVKPTRPIPLLPEDWIPHTGGDDLAVHQLGGLIKGVIRYTHQNVAKDFVTEGIVRDHDIGIGDDVSLSTGL